MSNETSPLHAKLEAAQNKADEAGKAISAYARSFANGNFSIRMLALVGGVLLCLDSLVTFAENLYNLEINHAVIDMYAFAVGFAAIVMESMQETIPYATKIRAIIGKNLGIVRTVTGRGLFYGVAGSLELSGNAGFRSQVIGYSMLAVGVAYVVLGRFAHGKMVKLRSQKFSEAKIKSMFSKYDQDGSESIEFEEFKNLLTDLEVELKPQEAELLYLSLDKDMNRGINLEEFQKFYANSPELDTFII
eukprot:scaffold2098_cov270-Chaetoceros_neogracile.AAC.34